MKKVLEDLYAHMAWADAELWRALMVVDAARGDRQMRERLHHIHMVQHAFLATVKKERFVYRRLEEFVELPELQQYAMSFHGVVHDVIAAVDESALGETVVIPWFKDPPLSIAMGDALMQATMHSQYHRGQNASRLRELGGEPPLTDYIVWLWKGNPEPQWGGGA